MDLILMDEKDQYEIDDQYRQMYESFVKEFGNGFGVVLPSEVKKQVSQGIPAGVYTFDRELNPTRHNENGLESKLFLSRSFTDVHGTLPKGDDLEGIMNFLEEQKSAGNIGRLINSKKGTLNQKDKLFDAEVSGLGINTPKTHHFEDYSIFREFISTSDSDYIIKHRFGSDGFDIYPVEKDQLNQYSGLDFSQYIVQERLDIEDEIRLIFLDEEYLGARIITDRTMPWEIPGTRKHITESYIPSSEEIDESRRILEYAEISMGCVDWVHAGPDQNRFYLEVNGVGTGLGERGYAYDLNSVVASKLREHVVKYE
jgi:hypothetical protein